MKLVDSRGLTVVLLLAVAGCSDEKSAVPGGPCLVMSDCNNPLSCTFGKCHEACRMDGDCPMGQRCVLATPAGAATDAASLRVCLLDPRCALDSSCRAPLVCGKDLMCRNQCEADRDCAGATDRCVPGGLHGEKLCVEPAALENGVLRAVDGGVAGDASPGDAGAPAPADGAADAPETDAAAADAADDGPGGSDTGAVGGDASAAVISPCGVPEQEPNETVQTATPYTAGTAVVGCIGTDIDIDTYEVTAPAGDPAGGYFQGSLTDVGDGANELSVRTASDNGVIHSQVTLTKGMSHFFYWAAAPGQTYRVAVTRTSVKPYLPFKYTFKVTYTKIDDVFEPNDTRDTPMMITLGTPVTAYFFSGFRTSAIPLVQYQDWYAVTLAAGPGTVKIEGVATDLLLRVTAFDAGNVRLNIVGGESANLGADASGTFTVTTPGTYRFLVDTRANVGAPADRTMTMTVPESFTRPYKLTVAQ